eukprot:CCRYP_002643-RA/>CCRYP_002643-RA protein AED:0.45 eAED:1.00 QI:0/-1/0/1/-1/0/1/0/12
MRLVSTTKAWIF